MGSSTVSWVVLTHNRGEIVRKAITHCFDNAGAIPDELVWVDNGSTDVICREFMASLDPEVSIINNENLGVAKGYNRGIGLSTMDYIVITGCDMLMPDGWLATFKEYVTKIPETGVACIYSKHWTEKSERIRKFGVDRINGLPIVMAMPIERRIFKRELLADFGYFPETFGLYGWDDMAWAARVEDVCQEKGLLCYVIPDQVAIHLGTEGLEREDGKDSATYHAFKQKEATTPAKRVEFERLRELGWPKFTPFL